MSGISIVIPCFNRLDLTAAAIDSVIKHTPAPYELIVVDDGSTDGTADLLEQTIGASDAQVLRNDTNLGFAIAANRGAAVHPETHVLQLNNDIICRPGYLEPLLQVLDEHPEVGIVGARLLYPNGSIQHAGVTLGLLPGGGLGGEHHHTEQPAGPVVAVTAAAMLVRRECWDQLDGFDERYRNGNEDVDLCLRAREAGWTAWYEPASTLTHLESQTEGRFAHVRQNVELLTARWLRRRDLWEAA